jgi:hypothetical protein
MKGRREERERPDEGLLNTIAYLMPTLADWNRGHDYERSKHYVSD